MKTAEKIQENYAKDKHYDSFIELLLDDVNDIDWHVANVQREYARQVTNQELTSIKINSIVRMTDGEVFTVGDKIRFSEKFNNFILDRIIHNTDQRRIELHGDGLFCTLIECECTVVR